MKILDRIKPFIEWPFRSRQKKASVDRSSYNRDLFLEYFVERGIDAQIARETWSVLVSEAVVEGFKPKPEDDLLHLFGLADEDLDEVVLGLLHRCKCRVPAPSETAAMKPVKSVSDLVNFLNLMKQ